MVSPIGLSGSLTLTSKFAKLPRSWPSYWTLHLKTFLRFFGLRSALSGADLPAGLVVVRYLFSVVVDSLFFSPALRQTCEREKKKKEKESHTKMSTLSETFCLGTWYIDLHLLRQVLYVSCVATQLANHSSFTFSGPSIVLFGPLALPPPPPSNV